MQEGLSRSTKVPGFQVWRLDRRCPGPQWPPAAPLHTDLFLAAIGLPLSAGAAVLRAYFALPSQPDRAK